MTNKYKDIINLPHYRSRARRHMTAYERAAQFASFKALTGYEDEISEAARLTDERPQLSDESIDKLNAAVGKLKENLKSRPLVELLQFIPDKRKDGGMIIRVRGRLRLIDEINGVFILADKRKIPINDVIEIKETDS